MALRFRIITSFSALGTADSGGYKKFEIRGHYMLANLLQELAIASEHNRRYIVIQEAR